MQSILSRTTNLNLSDLLFSFLFIVSKGSRGRYFFKLLRKHFLNRNAWYLWIDLGVFWANFIIMAVVGNFIFLFSIILGLESERGDFFCWSNTKIIEDETIPELYAWGWTYFGLMMR